MRSLPLLVALVLATTATVAAAGDTGSLSFLTASLAKFHVATATDGAEAATARTNMDRQGNADGEVTNDEVDGFVTKFADAFARNARSDLTGGNITLDGAAPTEIVLDRLAFTGATGLVSSQAPIGVMVDLTLRFPVADIGEHTLKLHTTTRAANGTFTMTVSFPAGSPIGQRTGLALEGNLTADRLAVSFTAYGLATRDSTITFGFDTGPKDTPPVGVALTLVSLAAVVLLARRRR